MGLDAVVYKRLEEAHFPEGTSLDRLRVHEPTGEIYFEGDVVHLRPQDIRAVHKRLGNMAAIDLLRDEILQSSALRNESSVLIGKVLYDGTHAGDFIAFDEIDMLKREILAIRSECKVDLSQELNAFLDSMQDLVNASERHRNPIVFL